MLCAYLNEEGKLKLGDRDIPEVREDEILIKVLACGICGTDIHVFKGINKGKPNIIRGHEFVGEILEAGEKVKDLKIGDTVIIDPNIPCMSCYQCRNGRIHLCKNLTAIGVDMDGGFAEYCVVPLKQVYKLPSNIEPVVGALAEPLACAIHGIDRVGIKEGEDVLIIGGGALGLILTQLSVNAGAGKVFVSEPYKEKRDLALGFGASRVIDPGSEDLIDVIREETNRRGVDVAIEAVGSGKTILQAINAASDGGRILFFGVAPEDMLIEISPFEVYRRELTLLGSFVNPFTMDRAVSLISSRRVNLYPLISEIVPLKDMEKGIDIASSGRAIRVLVKP
ncbi:MAG: zinc-dependent alcohol dehydrogenase family protein [Dictyoglomi bacterium]|jgi:2-desacetyl-2-hydroxyethyl bacteriochlorophyllide A dehydrogenase|nr:zinc-dependent alcohol dehydrogenase family protein [Dictyoglomota bacterium]HPO82546.1 zinc-dependent alcohol dehydrogenase family protein [bacterium]